MAMMTGDRPVVISVTGGNSTSHQTNYTVKVPYSSMARTIQTITKQGGKITNVSVGTMASTSAAPIVIPSEAPSEVLTVAPNPAPIVVSIEVPTTPITTTKSNKESKKGFKPKKK